MRMQVFSFFVIVIVIVLQVATAMMMLTKVNQSIINRIVTIIISTILLISV